MGAEKILVSNKKNWLLHLLVVLCCGIPNVFCTPYPDSVPVQVQDSIDMFNSPDRSGPCTFSVSTDSGQFPANMLHVNKLTYRIPSSPAQAPYPTIIIEPGFFSSTTALEDVQNRYASHGFLVIGVNNNSHVQIPSTLNPYKEALLETVKFAVQGSHNSGCKLFNLVDTGKIGVSGHSMGGGGTILACNAKNDSTSKCIKTGVAMNPFGKCDGSNIEIPMLLISSDRDSIINPFMPSVTSAPKDIYFSFVSMQKTSEKIFANFASMDHNGVVDYDIFLPTSGNAGRFLPTMVSWFKVYLAKDSLYKSYIDTTSANFKVLQNKFTNRGVVPAYIYMRDR